MDRHADEATELMRREYAKFPELALTFWQAQRLWNLSEDQCVRTLRALIEAGFLTRTGEGRYRRACSRGRVPPSVGSPLHGPPPVAVGSAGRGRQVRRVLSGRMAAARF